MLKRWIAALVTSGGLLTPALAPAQVLGSIAGTARDTSGAVLPGVTVDAASPALIEKIRTAATDGSGQYRIVNLPPGTYEVTFTLPGFNTVKREGIEVTASFTSNIDADLRVGAVEETLTVTGESPVVDLESAAQSRALTDEIFKEIPSSGSWLQMASLIPAVRASVQDVGGSLGDQTGAMVSAHGSREQDGVSMLDGLRIGNMYQSSNLTNMSLSPLLFEQVDVQLSGQTGESGTNGVLMNAIPKSGGNTFHGSALVNGSGPALQGDNITSRLAARGLTGASTSLKKLADVNGAVGGPMKRDRLWFYYTARYFTNEFYLAGLFYPTDPTAIVRNEDSGRQAFGGTWTADNNVRLTAALTQKQKLSGWYAYQHKVDPHWTINNGLSSPEAVRVTTWHTQLSTITWTYTATNRLLFEAGVAPGESPDTIAVQPDRVNGISIQEQGGLIAKPLTYRAPTGFDFDDRLPSQSFKASANYVTGTHSAKVGIDLQRGYFQRNDNNDSTGGIWYRTRDYVPNLVTIQAPNAGWQNNLDYNLGIYAQDRWTANRLTLSGGVRVDLQNESASEFTSRPHRWLPARNATYPEVENIPNWKDINPRISGAYDLLGNGRTALKASASRAVEQDSIRYALANNPANTLVTQVSRVWTDANGNFNPDCNLLDANPNGECGVWQDLGFGSARPSTFYDPAILNGWGVRPWNWEFSAGVQQQLLPRLSATAAYYRRVQGNFYVVDNEALSRADFSEFSVTVPNDPRIPNAGQTVTGLFDQTRAVANRNVIKAASNFGNQYGHWDGVDVTVDARLQNGLLVQGGLSTGKTLSDNCDVVDDVPESLQYPVTGVLPAGIQPAVFGPTGNGNVWTPAQFCRQVTPFLTQYKALASYTFPYGVRVSGTLQSLPGPLIAANQIYAGTVPSLGRPFTFGQVQANVIEPGSTYGDRLNQFDLRFSKLVNVGVGRMDVNVDLYNAFNSDAVLLQQNAFGAAWQRPLTVIQPRFVKFSVRWDF
jgi:hypothetical protein